ncbi:HAD family hydrolase [Rubrolithibacter danxiaensis]|uniref:HAD family hydrolase n=1 Tax=Rubrolithibacter danxiaensis TaxID=3390805 RepID=UPI003BF82B27
MLTYQDIPSGKKAFVFELDNVIYPEKDYLLQVYYLFASFIEYTETFPPAADLLQFLKTSYEHKGATGIFDRAKEAFGIDEKYRENLDRLHKNARLPLKLLIYKNVLQLLQQIVVDRKQIFLLTNGNPEQQLNKIRQVEWNGLEQYLTVYFADEIKPKPETDVLLFLIDKYKLSRKEIIIFGSSETDQEFAASAGVDYIEIQDLL